MKNFEKGSAKVWMIILSLLFLVNSVISQNKLRNIFIGDSVPNVFINDIKDADFTNLKLADFSKDKLVILDFWATWCAPCIFALQKMDSLQREYGDQLQVISVTNQSETVVREFLDIRASRGQHVSSLPKVFEDSVLKSLFPHNIIPHYVWIKNGKVIAISESVYRTDIESLLHNKPLNIPTKVDLKKVKYERNKVPLMVFLNNLPMQTQLNKFTNYSFLTRFMPEFGYNGGYSSVWDSLGNRRITATNVNLLSLLKVSYGKMETFIDGAAVDILSKDSLVRIFGVSGMASYPIIEKRAICYEILAHDTLVFDKMQQDLKYAFPQFKVTIIEAVDTCLVLEMINDRLEKFVVDYESELADYGMAGDCMVLKNTTMRGFRTTLEAQVFRYGKYPVVDHTGFERRFNIELCGVKKSLKNMNHLLEEFGLRVVKKPAKHRRLVIEDK